MFWYFEEIPQNFSLALSRARITDLKNSAYGLEGRLQYTQSYYFSCLAFSPLFWDDDSEFIAQAVYFIVFVRVKICSGRNVKENAKFVALHVFGVFCILDAGIESETS